MKRGCERRQEERGGEAGFTLVELMVSVILFSIVVVAVFSFFTAMSNVFHSQEQVVDAQSNLRFAVDFLSKDARRAGYLGTPSAENDALVCPKPASPPAGVLYAGVRVINADPLAGVYAGGADQAANGDIFPDTMYLMGSFEVSEPFPLDGVTTTGGQLDGVETARILGGGDPGENETRFNAVFMQDRMVKVTGPNNQSQLGFITGAAWNVAQPTVSVSGLVAQQGNVGCGIQGLSGQNYEISVLNLMRYQVRQSAGDETRSDLLRAEINPRTGAVFPGTEVSLLDYVVDFQAWVDMDTGIGAQPNMVRDLVPGDDLGNVPWSQTTGQWQRARALYVTVSARTPREDPTLFHAPRVSQASGEADIFQPLLTFNLDEDEQGAAHVVTQTAVIELQNLTLRNLH
jgi:prepilin-type N-terminal cleavage/methylation domain-containing protein